MVIKIDSKVDHIKTRQDVSFYACNRFQHICAVAKTLIFGSAQFHSKFHSNQNIMDGGEYLW